MPHLRPLHSAPYVGQTVDAIRKADNNKVFEQGNRIGDGGKGILAREKQKPDSPPYTAVLGRLEARMRVDSEANKYTASGKSSALGSEQTLFACSSRAAMAAVECFIADRHDA
ncbi:hypothetical protein FVEG_02425 [Fusarium verticillioides 7600]|uniref:Uncharacterized protein n=1 Tax=Gibberella moniliformis (strain M3125 / FGSC 7600) TaxID=334819 RepID=W7LMB2_GIBM7|nr:hypothetical protein FVEG_02425 [Fusarium verticillioides 7600]EWG39691.1 hypothetical protein FVEG_02425 [Fusarium verticillioides 7600]